MAGMAVKPLMVTYACRSTSQFSSRARAMRSPNDSRSWPSSIMAELPVSSGNMLIAFGLLLSDDALI